MKQDPQHQWVRPSNYTKLDQDIVYTPDFLSQDIAIAPIVAVHRPPGNTRIDQIEASLSDVTRASEPPRPPIAASFFSGRTRSQCSHGCDIERSTAAPTSQHKGITSRYHRKPQHGSPSTNRYKRTRAKTTNMWLR
ncbi:MAG: hypothetical protein ABIQ36_13540 [Rhodanobacter sp.]